MRTTLSIDDDVSKAIERLQALKKLKFREAVNLLLRSGLETIDKEPTPTPYSGPVFDATLAPGIDSNRMNAFSDEMELEDYLK
jgi:hypothetical protein